MGDDILTKIMAMAVAIQTHAGNGGGEVTRKKTQKTAGPSAGNPSLQRPAPLSILSNEP